MATRGWNGLTAAEVARMGKQATRMPQKRRSKYGAVKTTVDGVTFDSKAEARRYGELKILQAAGEILGSLILQPVFILWVKRGDGREVSVGKYVGDFQYEAPDGTIVVEDVKGVKTPVYRLKKKMVEAHYGIKIREVR